MDSVPSGAGAVRFDPSKAGVIALWCPSALFSRKERHNIGVCECVCVCVCEVSLQRPAFSIITGL